MFVIYYCDEEICMPILDMLDGIPNESLRKILSHRSYTPWGDLADFARGQSNVTLREKVRKLYKLAKLDPGF
jgi:hypothetical protein